MIKQTNSKMKPSSTLKFADALGVARIFLKGKKVSNIPQIRKMIEKKCKLKMYTSNDEVEQDIKNIVILT